MHKIVSVLLNKNVLILILNNSDSIISWIVYGGYVPTSLED
jgi:hypothetical protein